MKNPLFAETHPLEKQGLVRISRRRIGKGWLRFQQQGFALVTTLILMILLTVIAVGLLTLSSISLRSSTQAKGQAEARANARLALMLAIGELQMELGPDQRVNAVSEILKDPDDSASTLEYSHLTGVWNSRQEDPATAPLNSAPSYDHASAFRRWLVSSKKPEEITKTDFAKTGTHDDPLIMARAPGTTGGQATYAGKIPVASASSGMPGKLAWWVSDENSKGFINPKETITKIAPPVVSDLLTAAGTPGAYGMMALDKNFPANDPKADQVITHGQLPLAVTGIKPHDWFHDVSPYSKGLLTNVVQGGLRQDLNLYLEQTAAQLPWAVNPAGGVSGVSGPNGKYALSTVNDYDVLPWKYLYNYYHIKKRIQMNGPRPFLTTAESGNKTLIYDLTNPIWNAGVIRPEPILVRVVIVMACGAIAVSPATVPATYKVRLYTYPVMSLWNPYNVDLKIKQGLFDEYFTSLPLSTKITVKKAGVSSPPETYNWRGSLDSTTKDFSANSIVLRTDETVTLAAGEVKMFSPISAKRSTPTTGVARQQDYFMKPVPYDYSFTYPEHPRWGVWGAVAGEHPSATQRDQPILASGEGSDTVDLHTTVRYWNAINGHSYQKEYLSTFDVRGQNAGSASNYPVYGWGRKLNWYNGEGMPAIASPDHLSVNNQTLTGKSFTELQTKAVPFIIVDIQLKGLDEEELPNKTWRDCIPAFPYQASPTQLNTKIPYIADAAPYFANAYKLTFTSIGSLNDAMEYLNCDTATNRSFIGASNLVGGQSLVTDQEIPLAPFTSLAQLQNLPQTSCDNHYSSGFYFQNHAIGNSFASPGVASDKIKSDPKWSFWLDKYINNLSADINGGKNKPFDQTYTRPHVDRSYAVNHLLWDSYFFSSMAASKDEKLRITGPQKDLGVVVKEFFEQGKPLPNERFKPYLDAPATQVSARFLNNDTEPKPNAFKEVAANLVLDGSFNINSTSVAAWRTVLASAHNRNIVTMGESGAPTTTGDKNYVISRFSLPNDGAYGGTGSTGAAANKWQGYHELEVNDEKDQIQELAEATVRQVKKRGPFRSLAEFINRRLGPETDERTHFGALQAALEDPKVSINEEFRNHPSDFITDAHLAPAAASIINKSAALGPRAQGAPPYVTQADVLNSLGSVISARSDTFLIRSYGEALGADGKVAATAWCEAVLQRTPAYLDPADDAKVATLDLASAVNKTFGRRFNIVSFRWLHRDEI